MAKFMCLPIFGPFLFGYINDYILAACIQTSFVVNSHGQNMIGNEVWSSTNQDSEQLGLLFCLGHLLVTQETVSILMDLGPSMTS